MHDVVIEQKRFRSLGLGQSGPSLEIVTTVYIKLQTNFAPVVVKCLPTRLCLRIMNEYRQVDT